MTCNQIIKGNKGVIANFDKSIKVKLENPDEAYNYEYINAFSNSLYSQINKSIISLDLKKCTIIESDTLYEQLTTMVKLYFTEIEADKKYMYWSRTEELAQDFFDYENSFIEPSKFKLEYIIEILNSLRDVKLHSPKNNRKDYRTWFDVGIKFADGSIYKLYNKATGIKGIELKKEIFGENSSDRFRTYTDCTLSNETGENRQKNIFARTNAEAELKVVIEHCLKHNIEICEKFKEECREININI
jgi:hypothetical protein